MPNPFRGGITPIFAGKTPRDVNISRKIVHYVSEIIENVALAKQDGIATLTALSWYEESPIGLEDELREIQRIYNTARINQYTFTIFYVHPEVLDDLNELLASEDWRNEPYIHNRVVITFDLKNENTFSIPPIGFERDIINGLEQFLIRVFGDSQKWAENALNNIKKEKHLFVVYSTIEDQQTTDLIADVLTQLIKPPNARSIQDFKNGNQGIGIPMKNPTTFMSDGSTLTMMIIDEYGDLEHNVAFGVAVEASTSVTVFTIDSAQRYPSYNQLNGLSDKDMTSAFLAGRNIGQSVLDVPNNFVKWVSYGVFLVSDSDVPWRVYLPQDSFDSPAVFASLRDKTLLENLRGAVSAALRFSAVYTGSIDQKQVVFWINMFAFESDGIHTMRLRDFNRFRDQASQRIELAEAGSSSSSSSSKQKKAQSANAPQRKAPARIATAYPVELRSDTQTSLVPQEYEFLNSALTTIKRDDGQNTDEWIQLATRALDFMLHPRVPVRIQEPPSKDEF